MLTFVHTYPVLSVILAVARPKLAIVVPLAFVCLAIIVAISVAAWRSKLHMAGYIGMAFAAFAVAMIAGKLSGARHVSGTALGLILSLLFFFAMATALGCVIALIFYRDPHESLN